jgi:uncharacterized protein YgbK (DUF1537 family)
MNSERVKKDALLADLADEWPHDLLPQIRRQVAASERKVVVLDDDPTGTQTVHDVPVLTGWSVEALAKELLSTHATFYLLTNSRSLPDAEAAALNARIGHNLLAARRSTGRDFVVVSRSDSTLRGHYPREVEALAEALERKADVTVIVPFFLEGGRYTIGDVHYVAEGEWLVPAGKTEFARDAVFGYSASDLREWVEEKTEGRVPAKEVASISIDELRRGGPDQVARRLVNLAPGSVCIVNSASYRDLETFVSGLLAAEETRKGFLYRTAASFVRARAGLGGRPLLRRDDFDLSEQAGGLLVVGSYVPRTTSQLETLLSHSDVLSIEIRTAALLDEQRRETEIDRVAGQTDQALRTGSDVVIFTSRELVSGRDPESSLSIGQRISRGVADVVRRVSTRPRYLLAKGGITASDVATRALDVQRALVRGQILPGVPVWELARESRYPGLTYVVYPGNVGDKEALVKIVTELGAGPRSLSTASKR